MDAGNGDCAESEKCKEGNEANALATTVSHDHTMSERGESDCTSVDDIRLSKAENVWKPKIILSMWRGGEEAKTQEVFKRVRSILNKLMPQTFQQLMKQVQELPIDTEERLKGVTDLTFEKAISEPVYSEAYANMCRCLMGLKVPATDKSGTTVNFRKLLLNRCQKEFEKDKDDDEIFEKKQKELEAASSDEERQRLTEELMEVKEKNHKRSLGNIQFIGALFKLKMLTEVLMHDCVVKLLKNHDEESLECVCRLLSTIGKDLDFEKAKPRMDQYFNHMDVIIKERKTSAKIRFMLQDVLDLRRNNWVPRRGNQGHDQIHKKGKTGGSGGWMGRGEREGPWRREGPHSPGREDESWNTVPFCKNRPVNTSRLNRFTKTPVGRLEFNNQLLAPGGKGMWGNWGKGNGGSTSTDPANTGSRPATSTLNRFSALQSSSPVSFLDSDRRRVPQSILSQKFQQLTKQVIELTIDTEERLKEVIDLTFEKAISEPDFSVAYVDMCRCLMGINVPATDKPGATLNFRKLLLNRCQKEFETNIEHIEIFEKKQKELEAASSDEERQRLTEELEEAKHKEHRRSIGNIQFIGELFKVKMLTELIMHDCIATLIKIPSNEKSLECLCQLLSTTGNELDHEKAKPRMDQYFNQMEKIIKERKTSSRIRLMLQDVLDLRQSNWVPRRGDQGSKTIDQIHKEAEMEEHREQMKVQQALISKKDTGGSGGRMGGGGGGGGPGGRGGPHTPGRGQPPQDEGWNTVPISKNRPIDTSRLSKITKTPVLDFNNQLLALGGKGTWGSWGKVQKGRATLPPPAPSKPAFTEEELEKKSGAIIEEYLHVNDMKKTLRCVQELNRPQLLFVFVRNGLESTLERSTMGREHLGLLLHQLVKAGILSKPQYFKGLQEILEVAEDMAIDIPHIWLYLAELITPMLHEGGIPMGELFREVAKPLIPLEKAGVLLVQILTLLCKGMSHKKAGAMWREAGLKWRDYLPEDEDVNKFATEKNVEFTLGEESEKSQQSEMSSLELTNHLDRLIQDQADNQRIFDWIDANLDKKQTSSNMFVRALMTCICQSAIICENPYKVSVDVIKQRGRLLLKFLKDEQKELQALYALQALMVQMEQPANLLRMFFDALYDEDVIKEEAFYKWEFSKDPAEQTGKGVALKSVTAFFTWLREAEDESDN